MHYHKGFPCGCFLSKGQKLDFGVGLSQAKTKKKAENSAEEEERKFLAEETSGNGQESCEGGSAVNVKSSLDSESAEAIEATQDGSFWGVWVFMLGRGLLILGIS